MSISGLPQDPCTFEVPAFPNVVLMLRHYGQSLGVAGVDDAVMNIAITDAQAHDPHLSFGPSCTYVEDHIQVRVVSRAKATWGEWTAAAIVLRNFIRNYEFVAMDFEMIRIDGHQLLKGYIEEALW